MKKIKKLKTIVFIVISLFSILTLRSIPVFAAPPSCDEEISEEVRAALGCSNASGNVATLDTTIINILSIIIGVLGIVAVIWVIIGGVQYITSTGDAAKIEKAKKTILYALIGLVICALAFVVVNFVIGTILSQ